MTKLGYCWYQTSIDKDPFQGKARLCFLLGEVNYNGKKMYKCLIGLESANVTLPPDVPLSASLLPPKIAIVPFFREIDRSVAIRYESDYPVKTIEEQSVQIKQKNPQTGQIEIIEKKRNVEVILYNNLEEEFEDKQVIEFPDGVVAFGKVQYKDHKTLKVLKEEYELAIITNVVGYGSKREFLGMETDRDTLSSYLEILAIPDEYMIGG